MTSPDNRSSRSGVLYGIAAYGTWGLFPLYFRAVQAAHPIEILCHRVVWSLLFLLGLAAVRRQFVRPFRLLGDRRNVLMLAASSGLLAINWLTYIYAIQVGRTLEASLGYYINPIVNVVIGCTLLRERMRPAQWASLSLASIGVLYLTAQHEGVPWIALTLAISFGFYGLLRKSMAAGATDGLTLETAMLFVPGLVGLLWMEGHGNAAFLNESRSLDGLLLAAGVLTTVPLIWFAQAARLLPLSSMGFLQYLAPTGQFLIAVLVFGEPFTHAHGVAFAFIWSGLALFSWDAFTMVRRGRVAARAASVPTPTIEGAPPTALPESSELSS